ncbi:hypothetical protein [Spiroplasma endosymbiont of Tipula paludosa]|uniref:hypothetical protein n=1 Tax=Spiroplasma endosymbiont of Tipula paludosa TaxID=3066295 RepID=UPI0035C89137
MKSFAILFTCTYKYNSALKWLDKIDKSIIFPSSLLMITNWSVSNSNAILLVAKILINTKLENSLFTKNSPDN